MPRPMSSARQAPRPRLDRNAQPREPPLLVGTKLPLERRRRRERPAACDRRFAPSSSLSQPRASISATGRSASAPAPRPRLSRSSSAAGASPRSARRSKNASAAATSSGRRTIQRPRAITSGSFSAASSRSSGERQRRVARPRPSTRRRTGLRGRRGRRPPRAPRTASASSLSRSRSVHHGGASTPNPACSSAGAASRRNPIAASGVRSRPVGAASRSAGSSSGHSRTAWPRPPSSRSCGSAIRRPSALSPLPLALHTSAAGTSRLGSSLAWSTNSTRHGAEASGFELVGLAQPEARPERPVLGIALPRTPPLLEPLGEGGELQRIRLHDRIGAGQRCKPRLDRAESYAASLGDSAAPASPSARKLRAQASTTAPSRSPSTASGALPSSEKNSSARRSGGIAATSIRTRSSSSGSVVTGRQEASHRSSSPGQSREHPAARHELERELARLGQEPQRVAERQARTAATAGSASSTSSAASGAEPDRRNHPRVKQLRLARRGDPRPSGRSCGECCGPSSNDGSSR